MRCKHLAAVLVGVSLLAANSTRAATWENHIDASLINDIVPRGNILYMASFGGLLLYDISTGEFEQYNNAAGLPSNALNCLTFNDAGDIYIGTDDVGIAKVRLSNGRLTLLRSLTEQIDGLSGSRINAIAEWDGDIVYGATPGAGIVRNDFAAARYLERDGLPGDDVRDVMQDGDVIVMATDGGLAVLNKLGIITRPSGGPTAANVLGSDGTRLWVGTDDGVWRLDPSDSSWTDVGPDAREIYSLSWNGTTMWAGSDRNYFRYNSGASWALLRADSVLNRYGGFTSGTGIMAMRGLAAIPGGDVFIGSSHPTDVRGPNLMRFNGVQNLNPRPNAPGANDIRRISVDQNGSIWVCFASYYVGKLSPAGQWINYNPSVPGVETPSNQFNNLGLLADSDGMKWFTTLSTVGNPKPLDMLDDKLDDNAANDVWTRLPLNSGGGDGLGSLRLQRGLEDPAGNRWFLSDDFEAASDWQGMQILSKDRSTWLGITPVNEPQMISGNVIDVAFGPTDAYVALRTAGVQRWPHGGYDWNTLSNTAGETWSTLVRVGGALPSIADITSIEVRSDNVVWIGTSAGLFRTVGGFTNEIPVYVGLSAGILSSQVNDIVLDHDENLWVATSLGLNKISREDENQITAYTTPAGYAALSGLRYPLSVISPLANADCRALALHPTRNILYIGTLGGLSVFDAGATSEPTIAFSSTYVFPNPLYGSRGHNSLKIGNLTEPVMVEVYTLEGQLVHKQEASVDGDEVWDLTDRGGFTVSSGTYIVRIVGSSGSVQKTIAVLR